MKKILAGFLCLALLLCAAFAEELTYDPADLASYGMDVAVIPMEDFGMQFDLTADMYQIEVTEEMFMDGVMSGYINEAQTISLAISFIQLTDEEGDFIADYDALAAFYAANDISILSVNVNGMDAMVFDAENIGVAGLSFLYEEGWALSFTFDGLTDENATNYASSVLSSIRPIETAEIEEEEIAEAAE